MEKKFNFTKSSLQNLPYPDKGFVEYSDTEEKGLKLYVTANNTKTFYVRKSINGHTERVNIGNFPTLSVKNARDKAREIKVDIANNINPNEEKRKLQKEITLGALFKKYMEDYSKIYKKSWKFDEREIPKFLSQWFSRKISNITKQDIMKLHSDISINHGMYQANRVLERIKSMYNKAIEWGWDGTNPCIGVKKNKEVKRDRFIQPHEFQAFIEAIKEETNEIARNYIMMSLLTGARKSNVLAMRWAEIDFDLAIWHIPETKNGEPLDVPLTKEAIKLLNSIKNETEWVFPSPKSSSGHLQDPKKAWNRILKNANIKNLRIHDIRRTLASYQAIGGTPLNIIGRTLGHKSSEATQIYARLTTDPVRESMEKATAIMLGYNKDK